MFVAHTNLGLCYSLLSDFEKSNDSYQQALRVAINLQVAHSLSFSLHLSTETELQRPVSSGGESGFTGDEAG